jgi:hypothetical protein
MCVIGERLLAVRRFCLDATFTATQVVISAELPMKRLDLQTRVIPDATIKTFEYHVTDGHEISLLLFLNQESQAVLPFQIDHIFL